MCGIQEKYLRIVIGVIYISGVYCLESTTIAGNVTEKGSSTWERLNVTVVIPPSNQTKYTNETCSPDEFHITKYVNSFENVTEAVNATSGMTNMKEESYELFGLRETAGFVAIGFLSFAVIGYAGFVLWRRYLQNKYGNSQTLITEDVYDVTDLRYFEI